MSEEMLKNEKNLKFQKQSFQGQRIRLKVWKQLLKCKKTHNCKELVKIGEIIKKFSEGADDTRKPSSKSEKLRKFEKRPSKI